MKEAVRTTAKIAVPVVLSLGALYLAKYGFDHQVFQHIALGQWGGHYVDVTTGQTGIVPQPVDVITKQPLAPNPNARLVDTNTYMDFGTGIFGTLAALGGGGILTTAIVGITKGVEKARMRATVKRNRRRYTYHYAA